MWYCLLVHFRRLRKAAVAGAVTYDATTDTAIFSGGSSGADTICKTAITKADEVAAAMF